MIRWRPIVAVCLLGIPLASCALSTVSAQDGLDKIVILARHAEQVRGDDPGLATHGQARAEALAHVLSSWPVDAIYTSQYRRTRDTAIPLSEVAGVEPEVVDARDMNALLEKIYTNDDRAIVVIGHSNTVPEIARALGAPGVSDIPETGFDNLLVIRVIAEGEATLLHLKYGAPTPY